MAKKHEPGCICRTCSPSGVDYATPRDLLAALPPMAFDVCASPENAAALRYWTRADNALWKSWVAELEPYPGNVWMNPPYGRGIEEWTGRARDLALHGKRRVYVLVPQKRDTRWWREHIIGYGMDSVRGEDFKTGAYEGVLWTFTSVGLRRSIYEFFGRLRFNEGRTTGRFASALVVLDGT